MDKAFGLGRYQWTKHSDLVVPPQGLQTASLRVQLITIQNKVVRIPRIRLHSMQRVVYEDCGCVLMTETLDRTIPLCNATSLVACVAPLWT